MVKPDDLPKGYHERRREAAAPSKPVEKQEVRAPLPVYDPAKDGNPFEWIVRHTQARR